MRDGLDHSQKLLNFTFDEGGCLPFGPRKSLGLDFPGRIHGKIMKTSNEHERIKKWIGDLMAVYFEEASIEIMPRGQATMRKALKQAGAEPDESWCIDGEKEFPDLALEIALTTGGLSKLEIYRRFNVSEVWFWRRQALEIFALRDDGAGYEAVSRSQLLPDLDIPLLERCVAIRSWQQARRAFRAGFGGSH